MKQIAKQVQELDRELAGWSKPYPVRVDIRFSIHQNTGNKPPMK